MRGKAWRGGDALRRLREALGLTQEEMARLLGYSRGALSLWESGHRVPGADVLNRLHELFGVDVNALLRGEDVRPTRFPPGAIGLKIQLRSDGLDEKHVRQLVSLYELLMDIQRRSSYGDTGPEARLPARAL